MPSSSTGNTSSTRRSRLRCIQSALPRYSRGLPPFSKRKIRLCSSSCPTTLYTVTVSLTPGSPATRQQIPRTTSVIGTPAWDARYSRAMMSGSTREFTFAKMPLGSPCSALAVS